MLARVVVLHHEEQVEWQQPYVDVHCPAEKAYHVSIEEMVLMLG